jgi:capsule polysaccharide export protein KpsC/LpsZ
MEIVDQVYFQKKLNIVESPATKISRTLFYYNDHKEHNTDFINKWADHIYHTVNDYNKLEEFKGLKIIFYPLHFEPEATLLYFNPKFSEQINVLIETLKVLPPDYVLVVKEHPAQPQKLLSKEFVNLRNRVSNLKFLPGNANSFEIIKQSEFVLTIVGSVGWEALINNIPVVVLGNVYYDKHPGVKKIADFNVLKEICNGNIKLPRPKDEDTLEYAAKLFHIAFPANTNYKSHINDLENVEKFKMAIEKEIERYELEKDKYWLMNPSFSNLN